MQDFKYNFKNNNLYVQLPEVIHYDKEFIINLSFIIKLSESNLCDSMHVRYKSVGLDDGLCKAMLYCTLEYIRDEIKKKVYVNYDGYVTLKKTVRKRKGANFEELEFEQLLLSENICYYILDNEKSVSKYVRKISKFMSEQNVCIGLNKEFDFLYTMIGEIFTNSFLHSKGDKIILFFDIMPENNSFYLWVSVCDYGVTILENVQTFLGENSISSDEAIKWAIQSGKTTRNGSGGYGFPTMIDYIKRIDGELYILSGNGVYDYSEDNVHIHNGKWPGTIVSFKVRLNNLQIDISSNDKLNIIRSVNLNDI